MRYSTERRFRKYVKEYGFLSFVSDICLVIIMIKNYWILQQKQEQMLQKLLLKQQFKKTSGTTGDLIGNKIADKITSIGKSQNHDKTKKSRRKKHDNKLLMTLNCFE